MSSRLLALDLGSSSVRGLIVDGAARQLGHPVRRRIEPILGPDGQAELDPEKYFAAVVACIDELHEVGRLDGVTDVVTASQWHSLLALNHAGDPQTSVLTWADTRAPSPRLPDGLDVVQLHRRTGAWPHSQYWTAKVPWLLSNLGSEPAGLIGLPELLGLRLLGETSCSMSIASGTGLSDWSRGEWDAEAVAVAGTTDALLPEIQPHDWFGRLNHHWSRRWPQLATASWRSPIGDGAAANIGSGCIDQRSANVTIGTSAAVRIIESTHAAPPPPALWRYAIDRRRVVSGIAYSGAGNLYSWLSRLLGHTFPTSGDASNLLAVPAGSEGVTVLPFHAGARAPRQIPAGSGAVAGLSLATTAVHLVSATIEAVCFEIAEGVDEIERSVGASVDIVACGGAIEDSPFWQGRLAATLARPIRVCAVTEASATGAAILELGIDTSVSADESRRVEPLQGDVERLAAARARYSAFRARHVLPNLECSEGSTHG